MEAQIATIDAALLYLVGPPPADGSCPHPPEKRVNTTCQGGSDTFLCTVCQQTVYLQEKERE